MFGGLIGVLSWVGACIMFMLLGAMIVNNPVLLVSIPLLILLVRWAYKRFERWVASVPEAPYLLGDHYPHDWLLNSKVAANCGMRDRYLAELQAAGKPHKPSIHDTEEPMTIGGHIRHHHGG